MKAEELRIGNYFQSNIIQQVTSEHLEFLSNDSIKDKSSIKPISITTEWLERLGYEQYNEAFLRIKESEGWFLNSDGEITKSLSDFYVRCEYVHQLQNLYFALTGKELVAP